MTMTEGILPEYNLGLSMENHCQVCWDIDEKKVLANYQCISCSKRLCAQCKQGHQDQPAFCDHNIYVFVPGMAISAKCYLHNNNVADYWCKTCRHTSCDSCLTTGHKDHQIEYIKDGMMALRRYHTSIPSGRDKLIQNLSTVKDNGGYMKQDVDELVCNVEKHRDKLIEVITRKADDLVSDLKQKVQNQADIIAKNCDAVARIDQYLSKSTQELSISTESDFTEMQSLLIESEKLAKCESSTPEEFKLFEFKAEHMLNVGTIVEKPCLAMQNKNNVGGAVNEFGSNNCSQGLNTGNSISNSGTVSDVVPVTATRGAYEVWQGDVSGSGFLEFVYDMKFVSPDTLCCVKSDSIYLYKWEEVTGTMQLLRETQLDGHDLRCVAPEGDSCIYLTCRTHGTVHQFNISLYRRQAHTGAWRDKMLISPWGIAVNKDHLGLIAVADHGTTPRNVNVYQHDGRHVFTVDDSVFGTSVSTPLFKCPWYLTWDNTGRLIVGDRERHCLFVFMNGQLKTFVGTPDQPGESDHQVNTPQAVCVNDNNHMLVADSLNGRLSEFDLYGNFLSHPLLDLLCPISRPDYVDMVKYGDKTFMLVGDWDGKIKVFRV